MLLLSLLLLLLLSLLILLLSMRQLYYHDNLEQNLETSVLDIINRLRHFLLISRKIRASNQIAFSYS